MAAPLFPYNLPIEGLNQENSVYYGSYVTPITLRLRMDDIANYYGFGFDQAEGGRVDWQVTDISGNVIWSLDAEGGYGNNNQQVTLDFNTYSGIDPTIESRYYVRPLITFYIGGRSTGGPYALDTLTINMRPEVVGDGQGELDQGTPIYGSYVTQITDFISPPEVKVTAGVEVRDLSALKVNVTTSAAFASVDVELFEDMDTELNSGAVVSI